MISKREIPIYDRQLPISTPTLNTPDTNSEHSQELGTVMLYVTTAKVDAELASSLRNRTASFAAIILLVVGLIYLLTRKTDGYVKTLLRTMQNVEKGNFNDATPTFGIQEFNDISAGFGRLSVSLAELIYQLRQSESQAQTARLTAESADEFKSDVIRIVSHELRTPVSTITNLFEIIDRQLEDEAINPLLKQHLSICSNATTDLRFILEELLDLSLLESGHLKKSDTNFDPDLFFQDFRTNYQEKCRNKGIDFSISNIGTTPDSTMLVSDAWKLKRILTNLIENALKHTPEGRITVTWEIKSSKTSIKELQIEVIDTGLGIPNSQQTKIFDKFYQVERPITRQTGGWGLGLSLVKELCHLLGGDIKVASTPMIGSTFTVHIPVDVVSQTNTPSAQPKGGIKRLSVLIIDDNADNAYSLAKRLEALKLTVTSESDPSRALSTIDKISFDLIFVDYHMPILNGIDLIRKIRKTPSNSTTPVICMTADTHPDTQETLQSEEFDDILIKPIDGKKLMETLMHATKARLTTQAIISRLRDKD